LHNYADATLKLFRDEPLSSAAPRATIGIEVTPIENWLEIEAGFEALGTAGHTELPGDLLFKKPFGLTSQTELMIGVGPSVADLAASANVVSAGRKQRLSAQVRLPLAP
jgi:hypothetical protein